MRKLQGAISAVSAILTWKSQFSIIAGPKGIPYHQNYKKWLRRIQAITNNELKIRR